MISNQITPDFISNSSLIPSGLENIETPNEVQVLSVKSNIFDEDIPTNKQVLETPEVSEERLQAEEEMEVSEENLQQMLQSISKLQAMLSDMEDLVNSNNLSEENALEALRLSSKGTVEEPLEELEEEEEEAEGEEENNQNSTEDYINNIASLLSEYYTLEELESLSKDDIMQLLYGGEKEDDLNEDKVVDQDSLPDSFEKTCSIEPLDVEKLKEEFVQYISLSKDSGEINNEEENEMLRKYFDQCDKVSELQNQLKDLISQYEQTATNINLIESMKESLNDRFELLENLESKQEADLAVLQDVEDGLRIMEVGEGGGNIVEEVGQAE